MSKKTVYVFIIFMVFLSLFATMFTSVGGSNDRGMLFADVSDDGNATMNFEVNVSLVSNDTKFDIGDDVALNYTVRNTGKLAGVQDIIFRVNGNGVDVNENLRVDANETYKSKFVWTPTESGEFVLEVKSDDSSDNVAVSVSGVDDDRREMNLFVRSVSEGKVINIINSNDTIRYSGREMILVVSFQRPANVVGLRFTNDMSISYDNYWTSSNDKTYHYRIKFDENDDYIAFVQFDDGRERVINFNITGANTVIVEESKFDKYEKFYQLGMTHLREINDFMDGGYKRSYDGVKNAYTDVIDDSKALRTGPSYFGSRMFTSGMVLIFNPYMLLLVLIIVTGVTLQIRGIGKDVRSVDRGEDANVEMLQSNLVNNLQKNRRSIASQPLDKIAPMLNVPRVVYTRMTNTNGNSDDSIPNLNKLMYLLGEGTISENVFEGKLRELLVKWIRETVYLMEHSDETNLSGRDPMKMFPDGLRKFIDFIVYDLDYTVYEKWLKHFDTIQEEVEQELEDEFDKSFTEDMLGETADVDMEDLGKFGGL